MIWSPLSYLALFLIGAGLAIFDYGALIVRKVFYQLNLKKEEEELERKEKKVTLDRSVIHRRMTNINCKFKHCLRITTL